MEGWATTSSARAPLIIISSVSECEKQVKELRLELQGQLDDASQMKILFFCWVKEMQSELFYLTKYFAQWPQHFIIAPLIMSKDRKKHEKQLSMISQANKNITASPIYLKSADSRITNLLNPNILLSDFLSISRVIIRSRPDAVVCYYVLHAYPLVFLKKIFKFLLCVIAMGSDINLENSLVQRLMKKSIFRNCELIFARSWTLKEKIEKEYGESVTVIPSAADLSFFRSLNSKSELRGKWGIPQKSRVILTVCTLDKNKGVEVLIQSLQALDSSDIHLLIVGEGVEQKALEEFSSTLGVQNNVVFLGFRNREELLELYNLADIFALASYSEGLPRVLIEAMACECIPVVTSVGSVKAVVIDGYNGFTVRPGDYKEFCERITEVLAFSREKIGTLKSGARRTVESRFDSVKLTKNMVDHIDALFCSRNKEPLTLQRAS